jgi:hypothetical protein
VIAFKKEKEMESVEHAEVYSKLALEKMDGLWKRRKVAWQTSFVLWAGLVAAAGALYKEAKHLPRASYLWIAIGSVVIFVAYAWHWIGAFVSDEIGLSWAHYFQQRAEQCLGTTIPEGESNDRPKKANGWIFHLFLKHKSVGSALRKLHAIVPQIVVTAALMLVVLFLLYIRIDP